ncbi:MAG: ABC transporter substrate-binding protein [Limnospira sp.]
MSTSRRIFLKQLGCSALGILAACQAENLVDTRQPIKIGAMYLLEGELAAYGKSARDGVNLALEEINRAGGVNGQSIAVIFADERDTIQTARRLVLRDNVNFLLGIDHSSHGEILVPTIPELERVLMVTHAASAEMTGKFCNRSVFRCSVNSFQNSTAGAEVAAGEGYQKWTTIGPDYTFGHQSWDGFRQGLQARREGVKFLEKTAFSPLGTGNYNNLIRMLQESGAEAIWCSLWGSDLVTFVRQAANLRLFDRFPVFMELGAAMEVLEALGTQMPLGQWVGSRYWWQTPDTRINREFVRRFRDRYNTYPSYNAQNAYVGVQLLAIATNNAGSTDSNAVIDALKGLEYEAPMGKLTLRPQDHQAVVNVTWGKTAASPDYNFRILDPIRVFDGNTVTRPVEATGCQLAVARVHRQPRRPIGDSDGKLRTRRGSNFSPPSNLRGPTDRSPDL